MVGVEGEDPASELLCDAVRITGNLEGEREIDLLSERIPAGTST